SLIALVVPSAVEASGCINGVSVFAVGAERAVMLTVAPTRWKRSAIALPTPFVPTVTRIRLPVNSFASGVCLFVAFMLIFSLVWSSLFRRFVSQRHFPRELLMRLKHLYYRTDSNRVSEWNCDTCDTLCTLQRSSITDAP